MLTVSEFPEDTSSNPLCTASTMFPTAAAYFRPCSPSNTTPELRIIVTGCVLDSNRYPKTVLCDDSMASVCSSSGGAVRIAAELVFGLLFDEGKEETCRVGLRWQVESLTNLSLMEDLAGAAQCHFEERLKTRTWLGWMGCKSKGKWETATTQRGP